MAKTSFAPSPAKIRVIGLGGGGCNAITRMVRDNIRGVDFVAMNTDAQALAVTEAPMRVQLGEKLVKGLGVGGDPDQGLLRGSSRCGRRLPSFGYIRRLAAREALSGFGRSQGVFCFLCGCCADADRLVLITAREPVLLREWGFV